MQKCPKHPEIDTMVPCMGCGRYYCRLCDPPKGAGQYCPRCNEENLARLSPGTAGEKEHALSKRDKAGTRKKARRERRSISGYFTELSREAGDNLRTAGGAIARFPGRAFKYAVDHFPFGLKEKVKGEGMPPVLGFWYKILIVLAFGLVFFVLVVALTHRRQSYVSLLTALIVSLGITLAFRPRNDIQVAVVASMLALLALAAGEVIVYVLYRSNMIEQLDIMGMEIISIKNPLLYYRAYFYTTIVMRLLPAWIVAFTIALWPFPKIPCWRGLKSRNAENP